MAKCLYSVRSEKVGQGQGIVNLNVFCCNYNNG